MIQEAMLHLGYILLCARHTSPELSSEIESLVERSGVLDLISELVDERPERLADSWQSFGEGELSNRPFSDTGDTRCIRYAALGTSWTLLSDNDDDTVLIAERFAAGVQAMLAALAHEDLCLIPTAITVRIEVRQQQAPEVQERIEAQPSNDGREWVVRLAPTGAVSNPDLEEVHADLLGALFVILREASLLPGDDLFSAMERGFQRGLGNRLMMAVQLEQFVNTFAVTQGSGFDRRTVEMPWNPLEGTLSEHEELRWQDGPGPTYSHDTARGFLQTRYETLAQSLRITAVRLSLSEEFRAVVERLRAEGWLDWHILTAVSNITINYRYPISASTPPSEDTWRQFLQAASQPESATAPPVPFSLFTYERMQDARQTAMFSLLKHWGLECHQETPDIPGVERLLAARYGYWDEDVPHEDPFLQSDASSGPAHHPVLSVSIGTADVIALSAILVSPRYPNWCWQRFVVQHDQEPIWQPRPSTVSDVT